MKPYLHSLAFFFFFVNLSYSKEALSLPTEKQIFTAVEDAIATKEYSSIYKSQEKLLLALSNAELIKGGVNLDEKYKILREMYPWYGKNDFHYQYWILVTKDEKILKLTIYSPFGEKKERFCRVHLVGPLVSGTQEDTYFKLPKP